MQILVISLAVENFSVLLDVKIFWNRRGGKINAGYTKNRRFILNYSENEKVKY